MYFQDTVVGRQLLFLNKYYTVVSDIRLNSLKDINLNELFSYKTKI